MVNRMRGTSSQAKRRRSHHKVASPTLSKDQKGATHLRHRASPISGTYKGRQVLDVEKRAMKKQAKKADADTETK